MQFHELEIAEVVQETADARSFVLRVPAPLREVFTYRPGQFLTFRVPFGGENAPPLVRCYSLSSSPETDAEPKVTVKRIEDGRVSNWMNDHLAVGHPVHVMRPAGRFVLRDSNAPLLLFGGGSGITPLLSLLKSALHATARRVRLVYANRDRDSVIFRAELDVLEADHRGRLELIHHLDVDSGLLDAAGARMQTRGLEGADCYVCGPAAFMGVVETALAEAGVSPERVWIERFVSPPDGQAPEVALADDGAAVAAAPGASAASTTDAAPPAELTVHLDGSTHRVAYKPGQSVLEAVQAAGLDPPFACTEGYCGSCAARLEAGEIKMAANDVFSDAEVGRGHILACQSRVVAGPCEVRFDD